MKININATIILGFQQNKLNYVCVHTCCMQAPLAFVLCLKFTSPRCGLVAA